MSDLTLRAREDFVKHGVIPPPDIATVEKKGKAEIFYPVHPIEPLTNTPPGRLISFMRRVLGRKT